ncbi:NADP-dependent oxidoreductase [Peristeroidobacter agariperforans]|uniref:NADP-dependent oxidoreductase n=1 Tax=Peristeroidobacter agariperforans TaxID=268404 RepID=UPI00101DD0DC
MRAIQQQAWGGPEELRWVSVERPVPLPTEVLVRVVAAGVNPVDVFTREGRAYMRALSLPHIPGWDVSGIVEAVGYGVTRFQVGDAVFGMPWFPRQAGAYAEYVTAPARHFALKPASLSHVEAAALPLAGLTAWEMLQEIAHVGRGQRVLINAGAGGVGHLAVQIAKSLGAWVIATARSEKHAFMRELGADEVHDYTQADPAEVFKNIDVVIELVGGETCLRLLRTLRPGGLLISAQAAWAPQLFTEAERLNVRASGYLVEPNGHGLDELARLIEAGRLKPHIHQTFPLSQAREAQALIAGGRTVGKIVLTGES